MAGAWWKTSGKVVEVTCCLSMKVHIRESAFYFSARMARGVDKALLVFVVLATFLPPVTDLKYVVQSHVFLRNLVLRNFRCIWFIGLPCTSQLLCKLNIPSREVYQERSEQCSL